MKQKLLSLFILLILGFVGLEGRGQIVTENFDYANDSRLDQQTGWYRHSGNGNDLLIKTGNLTMSNYALSGIGNYLRLGSSYSDDVNYGFDAISSGTVICSFLIKVSSATSTSGTYFFNSIDNKGLTPGTSFNLRLFGKKSGSGYLLGIGKGTTATYSSTELLFNTVYLVILSYEFKVGTSNDELKLWVKPSVPLSDSDLGVADASTSTGTDANDIESIAFRQATAIPDGFVDGLKVSNGATFKSAWENLNIYTDYYSKPLSDLTSLTNWSSKIDGTGVSPLDFSSNDKNYFIRNTPSQVISSWIISGSNSTVIVGDGTAGCTVTVSSDASIPKLIINGNASVNILSSGQLSVTGDLINNAGVSGLVLESGASLKQSSSNVNATVKRQIDARGSVGSKDGWHFLSSPVAAQPFQSMFISSPPSSTEDFYFWDETSDTWINSKVEDSGPYTFNDGAFGSNFIVGKGYIVAYQDNTTKEFTGLLNSADVMIPLSYTASEEYKGYNLIGNPFPCSMVWNATSWGGNGFVEGVAKVILSAGGSYQDINGGDFIAPMNGFFVKTNSQVTLTAHKDAMIHGGTWYKSSEETKSFSLVAKDLQDHTYQYTNFRINPQATNGYDLAYDGQFMALYAPKFYSINGDKFLSTNSIPNIQDNDEIQLGFIKNDGDSYEITAEGIENIGATVYLTDLKTGQTQNLSSNQSYRFISVNGDDPNRFKISFNGVGIHNPFEQSPIKIFSVEDEIQIECPERAKIEVFSIAGQIIHSSINSDKNVYRIVLNQPSGYYIVRVTSNNSTKVAKVYIY